MKLKKIEEYFYELTCGDFKDILSEKIKVLKSRYRMPLIV